MEGKAVRETATERGREGVLIMKDEMKSKRAPTPAALSPCPQCFATAMQARRSGCGQVGDRRSSCFR